MKCYSKIITGIFLVGIMVVSYPGFGEGFDNHDKGGHKGKFDREKMHQMREKAEKFIAELETYEPGIQDLFQQVHENSKPGYHHGRPLHDIFAGIPHMYRMAKDDNELKAILAGYVKNELQSIVLSEKINQSTDADEQAELQSELKQAISSAFDQKLKLQEKKLDHLQSLIQKTNDELTFRREHKDEIIDKRCNDLLEAESDLKW